MPRSDSILVIGGHGHIGRFLVPRLVKAGWQVTVLTRGTQPPPNTESWKNLKYRHIQADYQQLCDQRGWSGIINDTAASAIVDIPSLRTLDIVAACPAGVEQVIVTGSIWMYGPPRQIPTPERTQAVFPFEFYRTRYKHIQELLAADTGPIVTAIMPANIAGPGKIPLEPYGGRELAIHKAMASGLEIVLPYDGLILVQPTDAEDVAEVFALALENIDKSARRMINAAASYALTYADMITTYSRIYGVEIPVRSVEWDEYDLIVRPTPQQRYCHEAHMCADITTARRLLGYEPKYTPETSLHRAVEWMRNEEIL